MRPVDASALVDVLHRLSLAIEDNTDMHREQHEAWVKHVEETARRQDQQIELQREAVSLARVLDELRREVDAAKRQSVASRAGADGGEGR